MKRSLAILGSTGSIGTQALEVISEHADLFEVYALTANNQVDLLINQARKYMPEVVVIANEQKYPELKEALEDLPIKVWAGSDAIAQGGTVGANRHGTDCHGRIFRPETDDCCHQGRQSHSIGK